MVINKREWRAIVFVMGMVDINVETGSKLLVKRQKRGKRGNEGLLGKIFSLDYRIYSSYNKYYNIRFTF